MTSQQLMRQLKHEIKLTQAQLRRARGDMHASVDDTRASLRAAAGSPLALTLAFCTGMSLGFLRSSTKTVEVQTETTEESSGESTVRTVEVKQRSATIPAPVKKIAKAGLKLAAAQWVRNLMTATPDSPQAEYAVASADTSDEDGYVSLTTRSENAVS